MSYQGAITSEGHYTTNSQGFTFSSAVTYQGYRTYYGLYCGAIGGWWEYYPPNGGLNNPPADVSTVGTRNYYAAPGSTIIKGTITPATFLLVQVAANYSARGTVTKVAASGSRLYGEYIISGGSLTITATAKTGYKFHQWSDGNTSASRTFVVYGDATITAIFVPNTYKLVPGALGLGAVSKVLINGIEKNLSSEIVFSAGDTIQAYQTPNINALFSAWMLNGTAYTSEVLLVVTPVYVEENIALNAVFQTRESFVLTLTNTTPSLCTVSVTDGVTPRTQTDGVISFTAYLGVKYTIATVITDPVFYQVKGIYSGTTLLSSAASYEYTKTTSGNISLSVSAEAKPLYTISTGVSDGTGGYGEVNPAYVAGCRAEITTSSDKTVDGIPKWLSKNVSIQATPGTGWELTGWNVQNTSGGAGGFTPASAVNPLSFLVSFNAFVKVNFGRTRCTVGVAVHTASSGKGTASVAPTSMANSIDNLRYGDSVTFTAVPASGFYFGGWFNESGTQISTATVFEMSLDGNRIITAKFAAKVTLRASFIDPAVGTCSLNGVVCDSETNLVEANINFGDTAIILAESPEGSFFNSWYQTSDASFENPLPLNASDSFIVSGAIDYTVRFLLVLQRSYLAIINMDNNTDPATEDAVLGHLTASGGTEITEAQYTAWYMNSIGNPMGGGPEEQTAMPGMNKYFMFDGTINTLIHAIGSTGRKFVKWDITSIAKDEIGTTTEGTTEFYSAESSISLVVNRHYRLRAFWGEIKPVTVRVAYGSGFSQTFGQLSMNGETAERVVLAGEITDQIKQLESITVRADLKSGFLFSGWHLDFDCATTPISTNPEYTLSVDSPITLYAAFVPDTNAIYEWAGSTANKNILWVSKRYISPVPISPSAARVYARGYPVALTVSMFESPEASASSAKAFRVEPPSQNPVRLPRIRPEKYLMISVVSGYPVEAIAVGTSMEGLRA